MRKIYFLTKIWQDLSDIRSVYIDSYDNYTGRRDYFIGNVEVKYINQQTLQLSERGQWQQSGIYAENSYQWRWDERLFLSHIRYGQENLQWLSCFDRPGLSNYIYHCGSDRYHASLTYSKNICLIWKIIGSKKRSLLKVIYE